MIHRRAMAAARRISLHIAEHRIKSNTDLWQELFAYLAKSGSIGCNYTDYQALYEHVRVWKPREILECGTGASTVVLAHALMENRLEGHDGRLTSMEEIPEYFEEATRLLPDRFREIVNIFLSPRVDDAYELFRGVRYRDIPTRDYDFVFVDGPDYRSPTDGALTFDFDFVHVVQRSHCPVSAIIDKRTSTCYVLQKILGTQKVRYDAVRHLGFVDSCTVDDLRSFDSHEPSAAFAGSFGLWGSSELHLRF